jgi:hypothetical protein
MDKYFNYGFNEQTWMVHCANVRFAHENAPHIEVNRETSKKNKYLNFFLPHNYGGFADPTNMEHMNLYTDEIDLPQIKPRTIQQKNEFYIPVLKLKD